MPRTVYYTATTLDGFIADAHDSLDWLVAADQDEDGPMSYATFIADVGALVMGSTTYEWVRARVEAGTDTWPYAMPTVVFTNRDLPTIDGADVRFARGDVGGVHAELAALGKDVWVVGGGDLAGQFADAGLLDEIIVSIAPVTLGEGRPLFPRRYALRTVEVARNGSFVCVRYAVEGARTDDWGGAA